MSGRSNRRWSRIFKPDARSEVEDELAFHFEQRVRENLARGMDEDTARAVARERLGNLQSVRSECTDLLTKERNEHARREWLKFSWLDFKLGFRMLRKYPGLTVVGGVAIAFAITIGAVGFEFLMQLARPSLPLPDGDRMVALRLWDSSQSNDEPRALFDFVRWREQLKSVDGLGVFRTSERNLIGADGRGTTVTTAELTASGFSLARVAPLLGRTLVADDERAGASAVVVIGERVWRTHFDASQAIIGSTVRLGPELRTVVGVMPEQFAFPLFHNAWIPFSVSETQYRPRLGFGVSVFGRLRPDVTMEQAQAELSALGARMRQDHPATHQHLQPQVMRYSDSYIEPGAVVAAYFANSFMGPFLLLIYANVALLMFGRAAARESEIVVRSALGASRARILTQLFTEALVLGALGAMVGISVARLGMSWGFDFIRGNNVRLPFWYHEALSPVTLLYAIGLTLLAALIAGVIPGLKVTRALSSQLRATGAGGGGLRFGGVWTVIIVAQVAFTVAFYPLLIAIGIQTGRARAVELGLPAAEYLTAKVALDAELSADGTATVRDFSAIAQELKRRLLAEPGVRAVAFAQQLPGQHHVRPAIEVEGVPIIDQSGVRLRAQRATVEPEFLAAAAGPVRLGRNFHPVDLASDARVVIVNESFVRHALDGRNPLGVRLRYFQNSDNDDQDQVGDEVGPWYEIVGVVKDLAMGVNPDLPNGAGIYHPLALARAHAPNLAVHLDDDPLAFVPRLRLIAAAADPALRVDEFEPLDRVASEYLDAVTFWFRILTAAGAIALLLALAGIYSIMSFTVARRTREIGVRVALGSPRPRVLAALFRRAFVQIGIGVAAGLGVFLLLFMRGDDNVGMLRWSENIALVAAYAAVMAGVCLLACVVPARRALAIQPTEALKADA